MMKFFRAFATVGSYTMLSRFLGFIRDILIASTLGAGPIADAFFIAFKLPNFFRRLFAEGAFNAGFIPIFSGLLVTKGLDQARAFAEQTLGVLLLILFFFVTLAQITMPWIMPILAPGFVDDPERFNLAIAFTRITFPYLLFISLVSLMGGVLNSLQRFAAVAAAPILLNICLITAITLATPYFSNPGYALSWGVAIAGAVQLIWLAIACQKAGIGLHLPSPKLTPKVRSLIKLMLPAALGAGVVQINLVIDIILASLLPAGSVSFLFYAERLNQLPIGVIGVAAGTALLPVLSQLLTQKDEAGAINTLNRAIELALLLTLPAMFAMLIMADELITTLFQRGEFDVVASEATAYALMAYSVGLPSYVLVKILTPAFFARHDTRTPVIIGIFAVVANLVLNIILMQFLAHIGLALATALATWLNVGLLFFVLYKRRFFIANNRLYRKLGQTLAATIFMAIVLLWLQNILTPQFLGNEKQRIIALLLLVVVGLIGYTLAALIFRALDIRDVHSILSRKR